MAVFDADMQTLQCSCEKALFSDFARYGAYTCIVKWDIFILWGAQLPSLQTLSKSVYNCQSYWQKFRGTFSMAHCVYYTSLR